MDLVLTLLLTVGGQVWMTLLHNWPFLVVSIFMAAAMKLYIDKDAVAGFLRRHERSGVIAATAAAIGTPLCSCGTTALVLGMMAGAMPWAPIVAFMVASPLTSPEELVYSAGLFGWPFAIAFFAASIVLGLAGGAAGAVLDARGWLRGQARFVTGESASARGAASVDRVMARSATPAPSSATISLVAKQKQAVPAASVLALASTGADGPVAACGCDTVLPLFVVAPAPCACAAAGEKPAAPVEAACSCDATVGGWAASPDIPRTTFRLPALLREVAVTGRRLLILFLSFATLGYLINDLIPSAWITALFGSGHAYSVPLAATLGLPFYINTEASLPLVRGMLDSGMSAGAALAFLITGAGTSIGAVAGAMTIARWRVIGLVTATLWVGAILCGFAYDALLAAGLF